MKPIFPRPQMPLNPKCLLFYFFQKIMKEDIENSKSQCNTDWEWKDLWFEKWKIQTEDFLKSKKGAIDNLLVLKNPNDKLSMIVDNLDFQLLYDGINNEQSNLNKSWGLDLYSQCEKFAPFDWFTLLQKEKRREKKWHEKLYKWIQSVTPNLHLDSNSQKESLIEIAKCLNLSIYPIP